MYSIPLVTSRLDQLGTTGTGAQPLNVPMRMMSKTMRTILALKSFKE